MVSWQGWAGGHWAVRLGRGFQAERALVLKRLMAWMNLRRGLIVMGFERRKDNELALCLSF